MGAAVSIDDILAQALAANAAIACAAALIRALPDLELVQLFAGRVATEAAAPAFAYRAHGLMPEPIAQRDVKPAKVIQTTKKPAKATSVMGRPIPTAVLERRARVVEHLKIAGAPMRGSVLADMMGLDRGAITYDLRKLAEQGLVQSNGKNELGSAYTVTGSAGRQTGKKPKPAPAASEDDEGEPVHPVLVVPNLAPAPPRPLVASPRRAGPGRPRGASTAGPWKPAPTVVRDRSTETAPAVLAAPVEPGKIRSPNDRLRCLPYRGVIFAHACLARQATAKGSGGKVHWASGNGSPSKHCEHCLACPVGPVVRSRLAS